MSEKIRIVLMDDHGLCRNGLTELLMHRYGMTVVGATGNADELITLLREQKPDLLLMDLRMEPVDGFSLLERIRTEGIDTAVVVLTMSDSDEDLARALRSGVRGYLLKDMAPEDVADAIRRIVAGEMVVAPAMIMKMISILQNGNAGGGFIAGQVFNYTGFLSSEGSFDTSKPTDPHVAIVTYWQSFEQHENSHADATFREKFKALSELCEDTYELGYEMLWQGAAEE